MGLDQFGNEIPELDFFWETSGGELNQLGIFTAVGGQARFRIDASATFKTGSATDSATVFVNLAPNSSFEAEGLIPPEGWRTDRRQTDATFEWDAAIAHDGVRSLKITASQLFLQAGFPKWETRETIPIDSEESYEFSAWYYVTDIGLSGWLGIQIINSAGIPEGSISSGTGRAQPNQWIQVVLILDPSALFEVFGDIAEVRLDLRLPLTYDIAGIPQGTFTTINFDEVVFRIR